MFQRIKHWFISISDIIFNIYFMKYYQYIIVPTIPVADLELTNKQKNCSYCEISLPSELYHKINIEIEIKKDHHLAKWDIANELGNGAISVLVGSQCVGHPIVACLVLGCVCVCVCEFEFELYFFFIVYTVAGIIVKSGMSPISICDITYKNTNKTMCFFLFCLPRCRIVL